MASNMTEEQMARCLPIYGWRRNNILYKNNQELLADHLEISQKVVSRAERCVQYPGDDVIRKLQALGCPIPNVGTDLSVPFTVKFIPPPEPAVLKAKMFGHNGFVAFTFINGMPVEEERFGHAINMAKRRSCGYDTPGKMDASNITKFRYRLDNGELWRVIQAKDVDLPKSAKDYFVWQSGVRVVWVEEFNKANVNLEITEEKCLYGAYCQCRVEDFKGHWVDVEDEDVRY